ncbi:MAG: amidohydrolase [Sphingobacteriia bacterium 35-40-8]|nr:MAG: amidohydrolase [Sphingobacteriia bacterium 35-40-8]OZA67808.1 MAG: amidohydrolase [Sphingobacteriia bacterium 39-39-8]HQR92164.1 amidohydrolase family protein [Sediminibacterium sp.]
MPFLKPMQFLGIGIFCLSIVSTKSFSQQASTNSLVIQHVNVITMNDSNSVIPNASVYIAHHQIVSINGAYPKNATVVDGKGKWLMPGLIDMHVHTPTDAGPFGPKYPTQAATLFFDLQDQMLLYIANGVTTIFELSARAEHFGQRNEMAKGAVIGPRMALAAMIDGGTGQGRKVNTPEDGRQAVRSAKAEGYEFIKVYAYLNPATYFAIIEESQKQGLKVIGHIPDSFKGKLKEAFVPGFGMVAHAEELSNYAKDYSEIEAQQMASLLKQNGTWLSPTLITMESIAAQVKSLAPLKALPSLAYVHPLLQSKWLTANKYNKMSSPENIAHFEQYTQFNLQLVRACAAAGVPIVAGTDAGTSGVIAGFSMPDELALLVKAGLSPQAAIASATKLPAQWLGMDKQVGSIEKGKLADLILLDDNPLNDIQNMSKIAGVFVNGQWVEKNKLQKMLQNLAAKNHATKDQYDWKTITSPKK